MADPVVVVPKPAWASKTLWVALVVAIAPFIPAVQDFVVKSPEMVGMILGAVFALLRIISKDKIVID